VDREVSFSHGAGTWMPHDEPAFGPVRAKECSQGQARSAPPWVTVPTNFLLSSESPDLGRFGGEVGGLGSPSTRPRGRMVRLTLATPSTRPLLAVFMLAFHSDPNDVVR